MGPALPKPDKFQKHRNKKLDFLNHHISKNELLKLFYVKPLQIHHRIPKSAINEAVRWQLAKLWFFGSIFPIL
jgi:hypothetical protein